MGLDAAKVKERESPEWWMVQLANRMLDRNRLLRFAILDAYRSGRPPLLNVTPGARQVYYEFLRISRTNVAPVIVNAAAERMSVRGIRTAVANDANGDQVAYRYWTGAGLDVAEIDVHSDMLTFAEGYMRAAAPPSEDAMPVAMRCEPWQTYVVPDPFNPGIARAAMHLLWDDMAQKVYAYLWLPGKQYVAEADQKVAPPRVGVPGTQIPGRWKYDGVRRFSFQPDQFTMRPDVDTLDEDTPRDGGPYTQSYEEQVVPVVAFINRFGKGEYEDHLDLLDRINHTVMSRVVTAAVQAFKQRALQQETSDGGDKLPKKDPNTGEEINWDEIFQPGPDALWKLPPGVKIWESGEVNLQPILTAATDDLKTLSAVTSTPFSLFSPDGVNQSAEGAQLTREGLVFKVEDRDKIAGRSWARMLSYLFRFGKPADRTDDQENDRADAGRIILDWAPAERYSLAEKAQADSQNKSLSSDMAAAKIWGLSADEVEINKAQRASEALLAGVNGSRGDTTAA